MNIRRAVTTGGTRLTALLIFTSYASAQTTSWELETLYSFNPERGGPPVAGVAIATGGVLFGTTDGNETGTVFSLSPPASPGGAWTEHVLHVFGSSYLDGSYPGAGVAIGGGGVLYGTTQYGGSLETCQQEFTGCGTVFSVTPPASPGGAWTEAVIHSFDGEDGNLPASSLAIGRGGVLYGTTARGGTALESLCGTVFSLTPPATSGGAWTEAVLYSFPGTGSEGCGPQNLAIGTGGELYGTSSSGGASNAGSVFSLTPPRSPGGAWAEKVLYSFGYEGSGFPVSYPSPGLAIGRDGVLYGTTGVGGTGTACSQAGCGTVFSLTPPASPDGAWIENALYSFGGGPTDGASPQGVVIGTGPSGRSVLYGTTSSGGTGTCGCGTAYSLTPPASPGGAWTEIILYNFTPATEIGYVSPGLTIGKDGALYGATGALDVDGQGYGSAFALVQ